MATFQKATKKRSKLRLGLIGPSGAGKTYSALAIGTGLLEDGQRMAVIDTERGSASLYSDKFDFDVLELTDYNPKAYVKAIRDAQTAGYAVCIIDSLSHAWAGPGGVLDLVEEAATRSRGNKFSGWREGTPAHNDLVNAILAADMHVICTMRSKVEWVLEQGDNGKTVPRRVGMQPVQRADMDYELTITADLDHDHNMVIGKTRCDLLDSKVFKRPGADVAQILKAWLSDGVAQPSAPAEQPPAETKQPTTERQATDAAISKALNVLSLPVETLDAIVNRRGFASYGAMPDEAAAQLLRDCRTLYGYCGFNPKSKTKLYTREAMLEELAWEGDGCPLSRLLTEAERAVRELEEVETNA